MPLYDFECEKCNDRVERMVPVNQGSLICQCGGLMRRLVALPSFIHIKGAGYPSRRKWMDNWTPDSPPFDVNVRVHGEKQS